MLQEHRPLINQSHVMSSPFPAPFKDLLEDQERIVCIEFQCRLLLSVDFVDILLLKVAIFFRNRQD